MKQIAVTDREAKVLAGALVKVLVRAYQERWESDLDRQLLTDEELIAVQATHTLLGGG